MRVPTEKEIDKITDYFWNGLVGINDTREGFLEYFSSLNISDFWNEWRACYRRLPKDAKESL